MMVTQSKNTAELACSCVRLTLKTFLSLPFDHRLMWLDEQLPEELALEEIVAFRAGYCEWISKHDLLSVSIGWCWYEAKRGGKPTMTLDGISSNVMLLDPIGVDLGWRQTNAFLKSWLSMQPWHQTRIASTFTEAIELRSHNL